MKLAIVSPHRDDAAFSLGLAVDAWLQQGHAVEVIECFTRSEFAPFADSALVHANDLMSFVTGVGRRESEEWRKRYGVSKLKLTDLNLKDAPNRLHCAPDEVYGLEPDRSEKVWNKLRLAFERGGAQAAALPLAIGGHVDHVTARDAVLATCTEAMPLAFYEDLPLALAPTAEIEAAVRALQTSLRMELAPVFASEAIEDANALATAVARKRRLTLCYDSQVDDATTLAVAEFSRSYAGRERLWANAAWRAALASFA